MKATVWTYDVWGNKRDGFEVNNRYKQGTYTLTSRTMNSDKALIRFAKRTLGIKPRVRVELDGDDRTVYVNHKSSGYPLGEIELE